MLEIFKQRALSNVTLVILIIVIVILSAFYFSKIDETKHENEINYSPSLICTDFQPDNCPTECVVCPPCPECSSISCQSEEFCAQMGITREWYENIQNNIKDFESCAAAGNAIMESYPRKCNANNQIFVEEIEEINPEEPKPIGGERDKYGCLGPAGYSWDEEIGACIRTWELDSNQRRAVQAVVEVIGESYSLTALNVQTGECEGCFTVEMEKDQQRFTINLDNWEVEL